MTFFKRFLLGLGIVLLSIIFAAIGDHYVSVYEDSSAFIVPGQNEITLEYSGDYNIYYQFHHYDAFKKESYDTSQDIPYNMKIEITDKKGNPVILHYIKDIDFSKNKSGNIQIGHISVPESGKIIIAGSGIEKTRHFSLSRPSETVTDIYIGIFVAIMMTGVLIAVGVAGLILDAIKLMIPLPIYLIVGIGAIYETIKESFSKKE